MSELYLHIGSSKTGSTSIQRSFFKSSDKLLEKGYFYSTTSVNNTFAYSAFTESISEKARASANEDLLSFIKEFQESGTNKAIISSEYLSFLNGKPVRELSLFLKKHFKSIWVICYIRHPVTHCTSQIQQYVKRGRGSLRTYYAKPPYFSPESILPSFVKEFGKNKIVIREFERSQLIDSDVVSDFCDIIELDSSTLRTVREDNASLSFEFVLLADILTTLKQEREYFDIKDVLITELFEHTKMGSKYTLPTEVKKTVLEATYCDLNYLRSEFDMELSYYEREINSNSSIPNKEFLTSMLINAIDAYRKKT